MRTFLCCEVIDSRHKEFKCQYSKLNLKRPAICGTEYNR